MLAFTLLGMSDTAVMGIVAAGFLSVAAVVGYRKRPKPDGLPLPPRVVGGMFKGDAASWEKFRELANQPPPPSPDAALEAKILEVMDKRRKPSAPQ